MQKTLFLHLLLFIVWGWFDKAHTALSVTPMKPIKHTKCNHCHDRHWHTCLTSQGWGCSVFTETRSYGDPPHDQLNILRKQTGTLYKTTHLALPWHKMKPIHIVYTSVYIAPVQGFFFTNITSWCKLYVFLLYLKKNSWNKIQII